MRENNRPSQDSGHAEITHQAPAVRPPARCKTNQVGLFGECLACGALAGRGLPFKTRRL